MAHPPGTETGTAVADVLFGRRAFAGAPLLVASPSRSLPLHHDVPPGAQGDSSFALGTRGSQYEPLFALGHGLSTTSFEVADVSLDAAEYAADETVVVGIP